MSTPVDALRRLLQVLRQLDAAYVIGGSVASSVHGIPRMTMDVDMVVDLRPEDIGTFTTALSPDFYVDADLIREAFAHRRAANLIHLASGWKFDIFPLLDDEFSRLRFDRRQSREIRPDGIHAIECAVTTAEDTILRKLEWYRAGGESSERQWNDLRGLYRTSGVNLDLPYLRLWASRLKVDDLLDRLLAELQR